MCCLHGGMPIADVLYFEYQVHYMCSCHCDNVIWCKGVVSGQFFAAWRLFVQLFGEFIVTCQRGGYSNEPPHEVPQPHETLAHKWTIVYLLLPLKYDLWLGQTHTDKLLWRATGLGRYNIHVYEIKKWKKCNTWFRRSPDTEIPGRQEVRTSLRLHCTDPRLRWASIWPLVEGLLVHFLYFYHALLYLDSTSIEKTSSTPLEGPWT